MVLAILGSRIDLSLWYLKYRLNRANSILVVVKFSSRKERGTFIVYLKIIKKLYITHVLGIILKGQTEMGLQEERNVKDKSK